MTINLERMEADLAAWEAEEREARNARVTVVDRCRSLDDAGLIPGAWSIESAIAFARVLITPGEAEYTPAHALASLVVLVNVPNRDKALSALQYERGAMLRERNATDAIGEQNALAEAMRERKRKRYRTVNNLTQSAG